MKKEVTIAFEEKVKEDLFELLTKSCPDLASAMSIKYSTTKDIEVCYESQPEKCAKCTIASFCPLFVPDELIAK